MNQALKESYLHPRSWNVSCCVDMTSICRTITDIKEVISILLFINLSPAGLCWHIFLGAMFVYRVYLGIYIYNDIKNVIMKFERSLSKCPLVVS